MHPLLRCTFVIKNLFILREKEEFLWELSTNGTYLFVCGVTLFVFSSMFLSLFRVVIIGLCSWKFVARVVAGQIWFSSQCIFVKPLNYTLVNLIIACDSYSRETQIYFVRAWIKFIFICCPCCIYIFKVLVASINAKIFQ